MTSQCIHTCLFCGYFQNLLEKIASHVRAATFSDCDEFLMYLACKDPKQSLIDDLVNVMALLSPEMDNKPKTLLLDISTAGVSFITCKICSIIL